MTSGIPETSCPLGARTPLRGEGRKTMPRLFNNVPVQALDENSVSEFKRGWNLPRYSFHGDEEFSL